MTGDKRTSTSRRAGATTSAAASQAEEALGVTAAAPTTEGPAWPPATFQTEPPWDRPGSLYFYGGAASNFASLEGTGVKFPTGWYGHPTPPVMHEAATLEHWFAACKCTTEADYQWVLGASTAASAKRRGSKRGENGRRITLRPDWEHVKQAVMAAGLAIKWEAEPFRSLLLATGDHTLVEHSLHDAIWGGYDKATGTWAGRNLLGIGLMRTRAALLVATLAAVAAAGHRPPAFRLERTLAARHSQPG